MRGHSADTDGSGVLDFKGWCGVCSGVPPRASVSACPLTEFSVGVWNYCTYDEHLITKFAFDIFDVDRMGKLDLVRLPRLVC